MAKQALFEGLVVDEWERPITVARVGGEAFYIYDDDGFNRHIESELVDRQVLKELIRMTRGHEDMIAEGTMRMLGQEDIFTKAAIEKSLAQAEDNIEQILQSGLPEGALVGMGLTGFQVVIDRQGELIELRQPTAGQDDY